MTRRELAKQAFEECCSDQTTVRYGVKRGAPFWNVESTMFMYVPAFHFNAVRGCRRYLYKAVDENGVEHVFEELDRIETDSAKYVALLPVYDEAEEILDDDGELIILKVCEEDGETYLEPIEDDNEFNEIGKIFEERLSELFAFDEE